MDYVPPVGFYYTVEVLPFGGRFDTGFQEVSGISATMETTKIIEGGENRFAHSVPGRMSYEDLVLKRGLIVRSSELAKWFLKHLGGGLYEKVDPRVVKVSLLDANKYNGRPIMTWEFYNAYPIKWEVSNFNAQQSEIVIETLTLTYNYFSVVEEMGGAIYPVDPPRRNPLMKKLLTAIRRT